MDTSPNAAAPHEFAALAALMRETIGPLGYYNERARLAELKKYSAETLRALAAADPRAVIVARDELGLTGFCVSSCDGGIVSLAWYGTATRARGRGVGAALLAALAATLSDRDGHKLWCDSRTDNKESNSVLERAGYKRVATLSNHWFGQDYFLWECCP